MGTHDFVENALQEVYDWVASEGDTRILKTDSILHEMVKIAIYSAERSDCRIAAFGLLLLGKRPTREDILWLVNDDRLGPVPDFPKWTEKDVVRNPFKTGNY
ncbi:hypothetical protein [Aristophania vespae]|uniref:hypothetical protein n=1 Tax=Aristophania vespae TaxID=2697033 RepID=UPI002351117F|nr:hypothetical protein [Aristophania vespae]UMM63219.1 hypothetical protein DM15PD_01760 [Aristophania vespae]